MNRSNRITRKPGLRHDKPKQPVPRSENERKPHLIPIKILFLNDNIHNPSRDNLNA
ncbi:MAG: hypothetical protein AAGA71_21305 [Pseudomonadota bacterium]